MELNLQCLYEIYEQNKDSYFFKTASGITYTIFFKRINNYYPDFYLIHNVYEFGFERNGSNFRNGFDKKIQNTIIYALKNFFLNKENVIIFYSDHTDARQHNRQRLFEKWKDVFDNENFYEMFVIEIKSPDDTYFISMILRNDNVHFKKYKRFFFDTLKNDYSK